MTVTLRAAVPTDAGEISRLYAQSWRGPSLDADGGRLDYNRPVYRSAGL